MSTGRGSARHRASAAERGARWRGITGSASISLRNCRWYADAVLLEQMFFNLLITPAKHAPSGTTVRGPRKMSTAVAIEVCDQGPGIAEQDREKVFDMFYARTQASATAPAWVSVSPSAAASSRRTAGT